MSRLEPILAVFRTRDASSTGFITKEELVALLQKLSSAWTRKQVEVLLHTAGYSDAGHVPYADFLAWAFSSAAGSHKAAVGQITEQERDWIRLNGTELEEAVSKEWVKLVRADYLVELAKSGGKLKRRQDLPPEAFVGLDELKQAGAVTLPGGEECLRVITLSYPWLQPGHPDPHGENLLLIAKVLQQFVEDDVWGYKNGGRPYGVLIDFTALPQATRTEEEDKVFKCALPALNVFYSHPQTIVLKVTEFPAGYPDNTACPYDLPPGSNRVQYAERGWCFAESAMSGLVKSSSKVLDVGRNMECSNALWKLIRGCRTRRSPPLRPEDFKAELNRKTFTSKKADFNRVSKLYEAAFELRFGHAEELSYHGLEWGDEEVRALVLALPSSSALRALQLQGNRIGVEGAAALGQALQANNNALRSLDLGHNRVGAEGAAALGQALQTNNVLRSLDLTNNGINAEGAAGLGQALRTNSALRSLCLAYNSIGAEGAVEMGQALQTNSTLQLLDLTHNSILTEGAVALEQALQTNRALKALHLAGNTIQDGGAAALGQALWKGSSLRSLGLAMNGISTRGATALGQALQANCSLHELDLCDNRMGDEGVVALGQALHSNSSLQLLHLRHNNVGTQGATALGQALEVNSSLQQLDLRCNATLGPEGRAALRQARQVAQTCSILFHDFESSSDASGEADEPPFH